MPRTVEGLERGFSESIRLWQKNNDSIGDTCIQRSWVIQKYIIDLVPARAQLPPRGY